MWQFDAECCYSDMLIKHWCEDYSYKSWHLLSLKIDGAEMFYWYILLWNPNLKKLFSTVYQCVRSGNWNLCKYCFEEASDACCGKKIFLNMTMNKSSKSVNLIFIIGSFVNDFQHAKYYNTRDPWKTVHQHYCVLFHWGFFFFFNINAM